MDSLLVGHGSVNLSEAVDCIDDCFVMQYNQIFIGMITMQYQAKQVCICLSVCWLAAWLSSNRVALYQAQLVLGWVTISDFNCS